MSHSSPQTDYWSPVWLLDWRTRLSGWLHGWHCMAYFSIPIPCTSLCHYPCFLVFDRCTDFRNNACRLITGNRVMSVRLSIRTCTSCMCVLLSIRTCTFCVCVLLSIRTYVYPFVLPSVRIHTSVRPSLTLPPSVRLTIRPFVRMKVRTTFHRSVSPTIHPAIGPYMHPYVHP